MPRFLNRRLVAACLLGIAITSAHAGLVTWYKMDDAVGSAVAADSSGTGANATVTLSGTASNGTVSAFQPAGGKFGGALYLNGANSWAETPDRAEHKFATTQSFTMALWFKSDGTATSLPAEYGTGQNQGLISKTYFSTSYLNNYIQLQLTVPATGATTNPYFSIDSRISTSQTTPFRYPAGVTAPNPVDNAWHHLVMVMDRSVGTYGQLRLYIDNAPYFSVNCTNAAGGGYWDMGSAGPLVIGNHQNRYCRGWFDDVGIWNQALTAGEIDGIFRNGIAGFTDSDNDGLPDSWEDTYLHTRAETGANDHDSDGLTNAQELQRGTDPANPDTDGDGLTDGAEVNTHGTNPAVADTDGDGLSDGAEITAYTTDPKNTDTDGDTWSDGAEVAAGTDPKNAASYPPPAVANVHINEFVAENQPRPIDPTAPVDLDGEYPDWIELKNDQATAVDLHGWTITDNPSIPEKYTFPSLTIPANGYAVIFCSPKKRAVNGVQVHTGFKLGKSGTIQLIRPLGGGQFAVVSEIGTTASPYPSQRPTVSYGRSDNTPLGTLAYLTVPTPGAANVAANAVQDFVKQTHFSVDRGLYSAPVSTTITCNTPGASIAYTFNGSEPTPTNGTQVPPADALTPPSVTLAISSTTLVRARAYKTGLGMSDIDTHSYIFPANVMTQNAPTPSMGLAPADTLTWGTTGGDLSNISAFTVNGQPLTFFGVNSNVSNDAVVDNRFVENDLMVLPTVSLVASWRELFGQSIVSGDGGLYPPATGVAAEGADRRASVELINPDGSSATPNATDGFQADSDIHIFGGTSQTRWKSYKLSFRVQLKSDLNYKLFGDGAANSYSNFVLDSTMNNTWMHPTDANQRARSSFVRDFVMADLQNNMGHASFHTRPVHLYLNGLYWGVYFLHEKPDHHFSAAYYGGDSDDYDVFKHSTHPNFTESDPHVNTWPVDPATGVTKPSAGNPAGNSTAVSNFEALLDLLGTGNVGANPPSPVDLSVPANYQAVADVLDIDAFIDYMLLNFLAGNQDWADKNLYASRERKPGGKWRFFSWDAEHVFRTGTENFIIPGTGGAGNEANPPRNGNPKQIHSRLRTNPEYLLRFADRIRKHMFEGGALSQANLKAAFDLRHDEIKDAIRAESARWGHIRASLRTAPLTNIPFMKSDWLTEVNRLTVAETAGGASLLVNRWNLMMGPTGHFKNALNGPLYPATAAPDFSQAGGNVSSPFTLTMTNPNGAGTIYFTTNGADPRLEGGAINTAGGAQSGTSVVLAATTTVKARVLNGSSWSALTDYTFLVDTVPASAANLVISEINYRPGAASDPEKLAGFSDRNDFEYLELMNIGTSRIDLTGVHFTSGITFNFNDATIRDLAPGARVIVVENAAAVALRYGAGLPIAGEFALGSGLANEGERLTLVTASGATIKDFSYDDDLPWPTAADGDGFSLVLKSPRSNPDHSLAENWRPSYAIQGTPGTAESAGYAAWKSSHSLTGDYSDSDGDGLANVVEYLFGTDPNAATPAPVFADLIQTHLLANGVDTDQFLTLTFTRDPRNDDVTYRPEFSTDLATWDSTAAAAVRVSVTVNPDGTQTEVWRSTAPFPTDGRRFAHIRVVAP